MLIPNEFSTNSLYLSGGTEMKIEKKKKLSFWKTAPWMETKSGSQLTNEMHEHETE